MSFKKILPIAFLIVFFVVAAVFLPLMLGNVEAGQTANLSQEYKNQLNASRDTSISVLVITKYIAYILAIVALVLTLSWMMKKV